LLCLRCTPPSSSPFKTQVNMDNCYVGCTWHMCFM
jgi:hypothetical protein